MSTLVLSALLVLVAFVFYWLWSLVEQAREARNKKALADTLELGDDAVPVSLHPLIDPYLCIGSGACVQACPEREVLGLVDGKATLVGPLACVGHGACASVCPVGAISLVFGSEKRGVELPKVDPNFQTDSPGLYVIGELAGMGLIRNAVSQGSQAAVHVITAGRRGGGDVLDAVVVGAGPAGISATLALREAGLNVALLEADEFGGTIAHYPRAKVTMTGTIDIPVYGRLKKRKMTKEQLLMLWQDIRERTDLKVNTGVLVEHVARESDGMYTITSTRGTWRAANVLLALGRRGTPQKLGIPGEDLPKVSYRMLEPREFRNKHVLVIGGGNSAVETALSLVKEGKCASVAISYRRGHFARCRSENRAQIEKAIHDQQISALMSSEVTEITPDRIVINAAGKQFRYRNDAVIVQIGGTMPASLLKTFGIDIVTKYGEA